MRGSTSWRRSRGRGRGCGHSAGSVAGLPDKMDVRLGLDPVVTDVLIVFELLSTKNQFLLRWKREGIFGVNGLFQLRYCQGGSDIQADCLARQTLNVDLHA